MNRLVALIPTLLLATATFAAQPVVASAAGPSVVETINGGGTAAMTDLPPGMGVSSFGFQATLYSDGSARGSFDCADHMGDVAGYPGNIFGAVTSWSLNGQGNVVLQVTGKFLAIPGGHPVAASFTVTIQRFGGAGVGQWTLEIPGFPSPFNGGPICQEVLTSGQIHQRKS